MMTPAQILGVILAILSHSPTSNNLGRTFYIQHVTCHIGTDYATYVAGRCRGRLNFDIDYKGRVAIKR